MICISNKKYKLIGCIATMNTRAQSIKYTIESLQKQSILLDELYIYNNDTNEYDATDNGKFWYLHDCNTPLNNVIYFTFDDDIIYPDTYIENTIQAIQKYNCIVTYHGRILVDSDKYYDSDHISYSFLEEQKHDKMLDVCGTGVTAFKCSYFNPKELFTSSDKRMSDLIFSKLAQEQNKLIVGLKHPEHYFTTTNYDLENSCYHKERKNERQNELSKQIFNNKKDDVIVYVLAYNRKEMLSHQLKNLIDNNIPYLIIDDGSDYINEFKNYNIHTTINEGKVGFYKKWQYIYDHFSTTSFKNIIIIPDDFTNVDYMSLLKHKPNENLIKIIRDGRTHCFNQLEQQDYDKNFYREYFIDCQFYCSRSIFLQLGRIPDLKIGVGRSSSGVGTWYTKKAIDLDIKILSPKNSFAWHGEHESVMHTLERKKNPLISLFKDKKIENKIRNEDRLSQL